MFSFFPFVLLSFSWDFSHFRVFQGDATIPLIRIVQGVANKLLCILKDTTITNHTVLIRQRRKKATFVQIKVLAIYFFDKIYMEKDNLN